MASHSFYFKWAQLLNPMIELMRVRTESSINNFIKHQKEIDLMAYRLREMDTRNNPALEKLKKGFLKSYGFVYNRLLPAMDYSEIQPLVPILDPQSSMDSYSKKN